MAVALSKLLFRNPKRTKFGKNLIRQADRMRDSGNPTSAALLYQQAIEFGIVDVGIRKQFANMLKDSEQYEDAYYQYSRCLEAEPSDGDTLLQLGHLFKLQGNPERAAGYYKRAANNPATEASARSELDQLAQSRSTQHESRTTDSIFLGSASDGPVDALTRLVQELSARVDGLMAGLASNGIGMSREDQVSVQEVRNNWYAMMPMFLNTASTIATMGSHIERLIVRVERLERLGQAEEARSAPQPTPALAESDVG